jgi:hypothetical protein
MFTTLFRFKFPALFNISDDLWILYSPKVSLARAAFKNKVHQAADAPVLFPIFNITPVNSTFADIEMTSAPNSPPDRRRNAYRAPLSFEPPSGTDTFQKIQRNN